MTLLFKNEIKAILAEYGLEKDTQLLDQYLAEYKERFVERMIPVPNSTKELLGQNSIYYIQLALCRSKLLVDGVITAINDKNSLLAMLAARAHFEVTGALAYLLKKLITIIIKK